MNQYLFTIQENKAGQAFIEFARNLKFIIKLEPFHNEKEPTGTYNFSDLTGKLKWKGNALAEQKRLRNEWE